jgi:Fibronectin type III-like domain
MRLLGFERVQLEPGESRPVTMTADPRLLAHFDGEGRQWHVAAGTYRVSLGRAADDMVLTADVELTERRFGSLNTVGNWPQYSPGCSHPRKRPASVPRLVRGPDFEQIQAQVP